MQFLFFKNPCAEAQGVSQCSPSQANIFFDKH